MTTTQDDLKHLERLLRARLIASGPEQAGENDRQVRGRPPTVRTAEWFGAHVNDSLSRLLTAVGLDVTYVEGRGTTLLDTQGRRYLDFAGAYGALPLGHNPDAVWRAVDAVRTTAEPSLVQLSVTAAAAELARALVEIAPAGLESVTFANSGTEAVEAALKMARSATGRMAVLSTDRSFHGKTLGALSATGNPAYQEGFAAPVPGHDTVPFGDARTLRERLASERYAAVIVEPIQGEGGVNVPPTDYLPEVRAACSETGTLLIADEVQTGLGRTGRLLASTAHGVVPDIITLAKALGGGMVPMGAVLARPDVVTEHYGLRHTSTFAGGSLACRVGLAVLHELRRDGLLENVRVRHDQLVTGLHRLAAAHPNVITDVRGDGLLIGVELSDDIRLAGRQSLMGSIAAGGNLSMLMASHLLAVHQIRIAPTLFGNRVLRVEPPLTVSERECADFLDAMEATVRLVSRGDTGSLIAHLVDRQPMPEGEALPEGHVWRGPEDDEYRFAFIAHPLDTDNVEDFDETLAGWSVEQRTRLLERFADAGSVLNPAPFLVGSGSVRSATGAKVHGELIGIPYTARQLMSAPSAEAVEVVRQAVELAAERGAQLVGLGAYSSIVTDNARALGETPVPVTTGNTFTAASSVLAIRDAVAATGRQLHTMTVAVIGAGGSIGRVIATALAPDVGRLLLVGRPGGESSPRLLRTHAAVLEQIEGQEEAATVEVSTDAAAAAGEADVVVTATSSPGTLLGAGDLRPGTVVCDVAQPPNIAADAAAAVPSVRFFDGGIVALPEGQDFGLRHGLPRGVTYACMAETMVLGLEAAEGYAEPGLLSRGDDLSLENVNRLASLAQKHGFTLAEAKTWRTDVGRAS